MSKLLRLTDYNPLWQEEFTRLRDFLTFILRDLALDIVHVGSTSVPTMKAKPILDIDIIYEEQLPEIIRILLQNNYLYEGDKGIKHRHAFKQLTTNFYEHHLYVVKKGTEPLHNHLTIKRALQNNKKYRDLYSDLKSTLIAKNRKDRGLYTESKTSLIQTILKEGSIMKSIVLAGGCFWGVEAYFKQLNGVIDTEVGYINGNGETSYEEVCNASGHAEAVLIKYDDEVISLKKLLDHMFNIIDPTSINKQGNDVGIQYRSGIYNYLKEQKPFIENYFNIRQKEYRRPIHIELKTDLVFYPAEDYHQDYLHKNKNGYCHVDLNSHKNVE